MQRKDKPTSAAFGLLRAALARLGYTQAQITEAVGSAVSGRTRAQIAAQLAAWISKR